jgi:murein DD-endopeptidase MepM/ murein hydrolase activator NlpD
MKPRRVPFLFSGAMTGKAMLLSCAILVTFSFVFRTDTLLQAAPEANDQRLILLVDKAEELPRLSARLEQEGYDLTRVPQTEWAQGKTVASLVDELKQYDTALVYIHHVMKENVEQALIEYAEGGGRLLVLHHAIASSKMKNPDWLDFLGIALYPRDHAEYPWHVSGAIPHTMVNLAPEHYITTHDVDYERTVSYRSPDREDLRGELPAFDLENTEIFHHQRFTDGNEKVILFGYLMEETPEDSKKKNMPSMEDTSGWYKETGKGLVFYLQPGHATSDFLNPNFSQIILNCLRWRPDDPAFCAGESRKPIRVNVDLKKGETKKVRLSDGSEATVRLIDVASRFDTIRRAVRYSEATIEVNGQKITIPSATYHLPKKCGGVWVDCPVTADYVHKRGGSTFNPWSLAGDARLRLWPGDARWIDLDDFGYPAGQRWFATDTQMANDPCYVDASDGVGRSGNIYYHYGLDFGGSEKQVEVLSATDGLVVSVGDNALFGYAAGSPVRTRYDVVYVLDRRGWFYRYSHLSSIEADLFPGRRVRKGELLGYLGKEGGSGGWAHLHFGIDARQPNGRFGAEEGYPFIWQAYQKWKPTPLVAVARPHHLIEKGQSVTLDGTKSFSRLGPEGIAEYRWTLCDGSKREGAKIEKHYPAPGVYSEILEVTDREGRKAWDFAVVQVADPERPKEDQPPVVHVVYYPTFDLRPGQPITFKVRSFGVEPTEGEEIWDFGDGSPEVRTQSDGNEKVHAEDGYVAIEHVFEKPGDYLVSVRRTNDRGDQGIGRVWVKVLPEK